MTLGQAISVGPFTFPVIRLLILAGLARVLLRCEWKGTRIVGLDILMVVWATWYAVASAFHKEPSSTLVTYLGHIYNSLGTYILVRCFCRTFEDFANIIKLLALLLLPVALEMVAEKMTGNNAFSVLGGVTDESMVRDGKIRAQGPFRHPILAGTVGASSLILMIGIWAQHRKHAILGVLAAILMTLASASSGPMLTMLVGIAAVVLWRWRHLTRYFLWGAVVAYLVLECVMSRPAYYIIAYFDLTGSSTGYHRARIVQSAFEHLQEWWFAGTDYTRHWMAYGVSWSEDHADITNHYLGQGVRGGVLLMLLFMAVVFFGFRNISRTLKLMHAQPSEHRFLVWCLGSALFGHAVTLTSVAYFDQTVLFLYLALAVSASFWAAGLQKESMTSGSEQANPTEAVSAVETAAAQEFRNGLGQ